MPDEHAPRVETLERDLYRLIERVIPALTDALNTHTEYSAVGLMFLHDTAAVEHAESLALELADRYGVAA